MNAFRNVVFGGGAMHGCMYIGALQGMCGGNLAAYQAWHKEVKCFAGTSVGSLFAFLFSVWDPWRIAQYVKDSAGFKLISATLFDQNFKEVTSQMSVSSGLALERVLQNGVKDALGNQDITLQQMYHLTGKKLVVTVTQVSTGQVEYWSHETMPGLKIWEALRASAAVPFLFPNFEINGRAYCDGGIACNIPCHLFSPKTTLTLFVHVEMSPVRNPFINMWSHYSSAAQLGPMRSKPLYSLHSIPCTPNDKLTGRYEFGVDSSDIDKLVEQGLYSWHVVVFRNLVLFLTLLHAACFFRGRTVQSQPNIH